MSPEFRIGDTERDQAVTALGEHYAAGRLTKEEYDERAAAAWVARTESGLRPLFADLPAPHGRTSTPPAVPAPDERRRRRQAGPRGRGRPWPVLPVFPILLGLFLLALLTPFPWFPFWVVLVLAWCGRAVFWGHWRRSHTSGSARPGRGSWA